MIAFLPTLFYLLAGLLLLAGIAYLVFLAWLYWWQISRAQPQHDGQYNSPIFAALVEVLRDKHGIPHIYAASRADLFRAQGLAHAQDRFWQMERGRRTARGTLAELFGEAALDADRFTRTVGLLRAAQGEWDALDDETRQSLTWYAEGVNDWLQRRPGRIAPELNLLRVSPAKWEPVDSLAIGKLMAWGLSANWESEVVRLRLLLAGDPYRAADLEASAPKVTPLIIEADGVTRERLLHTAGLLLNFMEPLKQWLGAYPSAESASVGSNAWVVAPKLSMTRKPILASDPHLTAQIPGVWYENHLAAGDFEVTGASIPGLPGVVIGHNEELAWGLSNGNVDQQDLFLERAHPDNEGEGATLRFAHGEDWVTAEVREEVIRVRHNATPHIERVVSTQHGPLVTPLLGKDIRARGLPLALCWSGAQLGGVVSALLKLNAATTLDEADSALALWHTPSQNVVLADQRGNIRWVLAGAIPLRGDGAGVVPTAGWLPETAWQGMAEYADAPRLTNPESGRIVTANNKPVGDDFAHFLGIEFDPGWRAARIEEILGERERYSVRDMEEIQQDTLDMYAAELVRWITLVTADDPWEKVALQDLRKWNLRMDVESVPALLYHYILVEMLALLYADKLGGVGMGFIGNSLSPIDPFSSHTDKAQQRLLELLNEEDRSVWYHDGVTGEQRTRMEFLQLAFSKAVRRVRDTLGDSSLKWQWGRSHQVTYAHPLGSARLLGRIFNRGPIPVGGNQNTPLLSRIAPTQPLGMVQVIPSWRMIVEAGNWDMMQSVNATGQSGHPMDANYDNQIVMWREGVYHLNPWGRAAVEKAAIKKLVLSS